MNAREKKVPLPKKLADIPVTNYMLTENTAMLRDQMTSVQLEIRSVDQKVDSLDKKIDSLEMKFESRFTAIDARLVELSSGIRELRVMHEEQRAANAVNIDFFNLVLEKHNALERRTEVLERKILV